MRAFEFLCSAIEGSPHEAELKRSHLARTIGRGEQFGALPHREEQNK
jgi:hypothetical protein